MLKHAELTSSQTVRPANIAETIMNINIGQVLNTVAISTCVRVLRSCISLSGTNKTIFGAVTTGIKGKSLNWSEFMPFNPIVETAK